MKNMSFSTCEYEALKKINYLYNVPRIIFGARSIEKLTEEIWRVGSKNAKLLLLSDKGLQKAGIVDQVTSILEKEKIDVTVFAELSGEPTLASMRAPAEIIRSKEYEKNAVIVGLGGGSVIDTAKMTAILATYPGGPENYFTFPEHPRVDTPPIPKIMVSTTAGTGSEVTYFVVIRDSSGLKDFFTTPYATPDVSS